MEDKHSRKVRYDSREKKVYIDIHSQGSIKDKENNEAGFNVVDQHLVWDRPYAEQVLKETTAYQKSIETSIKKMKDNLDVFKDSKFDGMEEFLEKINLAEKYKKKTDMENQLKDTENALKEIKKNVNELRDVLK